MKFMWRTVVYLQQLLDDYPKCFIVGADNVGSKQMQTIRLSLRGKAVVLMGKNTMMRKAIRGHLENNPALEKWVYWQPLFYDALNYQFLCSRLVTVQLVSCCIVVPPAKINLFPAIPVCLHPSDSQGRKVSDIW